MRKLKISTIILLSSLFFASVSNANTKTETAVETMPVSSAPVMQAGGYSNISNANLQEFLNQGVLLVDIRREEEWQQTGIVKDSKTITFFDKMGNINNDFVPQFTAIAKPDQPVMLICRTGNRTQAVSRALVEQLGYKNVMNVTTGIVGWIAEKRSVDKY